MAPRRNRKVLFYWASGCCGVVFFRNLLKFHIHEWPQFYEQQPYETPKKENQSTAAFYEVTGGSNAIDEQFFSRHDLLNKTQRRKARKNRDKIRRDGFRPFPDSAFKIRFPILLASLPKSGTTTIHSFFKCGRARSVHTYCPRQNGTIRAIGVLMERNVHEGLPPFLGCGDSTADARGPAKVFTDNGYASDDGRCYYPSINSLDALYAAYPNMTLMLGTRNATNWYQSLQRWNGGSLLDRWKLHCRFMPKNDSLAEFVEFYHWHTRHVRQFAQQHPSISYVEFSIDSPSVGEYLEKKTGISSNCWGHFQPDSPINLKGRRGKR
jgi:hypothetical protein